MQSWYDELSLLNDIARSFLRMFMVLLANGPFFVGLLHVSQLFKPLDHFINTTFLSEQPQCNNLLRNLLRLPIRERGLEIVEWSKVTISQYANSLMVTTSLVATYVTGRSSATVLDAHDQMFKAKSEVHCSNWEQTRRHFDNIYQQLSAPLKLYICELFVMI